MKLINGGYGNNLTLLEVNDKGEFHLIKSIPCRENPSFFVYNSKNRILYVVHELSQGSLGMYDLEFNPKTKNEEYPLYFPTEGNGPCHLAVSPNGKLLGIANYGDGRVSIYSISSKGIPEKLLATASHKGAGPDSIRQDGPHAHGITFSPDNRFLYVCDLGIDRVMGYHVENLSSPRGEITGNPAIYCPPGSGPRHMVMNETHAYVVHELSSDIEVYAYNNDGTFTLIQSISTLPLDFSAPNTASEILIHPNKEFLYVSNRGHNSLVLFKIHETTKILAYVEHVLTGGQTPRHFSISPDGTLCFVANQDSDEIRSFFIDPLTGSLSPTGARYPMEKPTCTQVIDN